ncbi:MAG TPA: glycosyltransferase [Bryobacteraceae bacterium]|jgi:glycosyltransferase involved in cell wall biosynthesis|nr:glycosyltransferase [Bryobacteraceae bacterium]
MKVLHVPFCYYPDPVGGTEVYVASLARVQRARGYDVGIAAPDEATRSYSHDGFAIHRFGTAPKMDLRQLYGEGDPAAAANFARVLDRVQPDLLHLHAFTSAVSAGLAHVARARGIPVVFTYHTPTVTCCRGTMLERGTRVCDGEMRVHRCAACMLDGKQLPGAASRLLGSLPESVGRFAGHAGLEGGMWTALRSTELVGVRHASARRFLCEETSHVFAVCEWVRSVLVANGVPPGKITLSRQGLPYPVTSAHACARAASRPLRLAFLGRLDPVKGLDVLIDALATIPHVDLQLDVFAVVQTEAARRREAALIEQLRTDRRIQLVAPLDAADVVERLKDYDALVVPSQWLESGPLVVYEAFAAGIPVVGTNLGGIAELVRDGETGLLVEPRSIAAWAATIQRLFDEPELLRRLKASPKPVRTAEDAADDAARVYGALLNPAASVAGANRL